MEKLKKIDKKQIKLFLIILALASFLCLGFLIPHKITDSYWNIQDGYDIYKLTPLKDGRIIHYLILSIVSKSGIPMEAWILISQYISIILYSIAIFNIYKLIKNIVNKKLKVDIKRNNKIINAVILLGSFLIILNPMTVECFAYVENIIMSLSILIITYASKILSENKTYSYIKALFLMLLAALAYQGTLNMWILLSLLFFSLNDEDKKIKDWVKYLLKIASIVIILLIFMMGVLKFCELMTNEKQQRIEGFPTNIESKIYLIIVGIKMVITTITFGLFPKYLIFSAIIITLILLCLFSKKKSTILKYLFCILIVILSCIIPVFLQKTIAISARISLCIGGIIGFSVIYTLVKTLNNEKYNISYLLLSFSIIYLIINIFDYYSLAIMNQITNKEEEKFCKEINECIIEYEKNSEYEVNNVMFIRSSRTKDTFNNFPKNTFTQKALLAVYANKHCLNYYTGRNLEKNDVTKEIYIMHKKSKEWTESKNENINFYKETVYVIVP